MATEQLRYEITADTSGFTKALSRVSSKLQSFGKSLTRNITLPLAAASVASIKFASDLEEAMTKADAVFKDSSTEMKRWAANSASAFGTSKADALEFSSTIASIAQALGFTNNKAKDFGRNITELSADFASFYNTSTEIARTGLMSIFTGETKPLKKFGVVMTEVNLEQFALTQGVKKNIRSMSQAEKVQLRYQYLLANSKNVIGDFARTSGGLANKTRILQSTFVNLAGEIGTVLMPIAQKLVDWAQGLVTWWRELEGETKNLYAGFLLLAAAIGPIITGLGLLLTPIGLIIAALAGITWAVVEFWDVISPVIVKVVNYFIELYNNILPLRVLIGFVWQAFKTFFDGIVLGFKLAFSNLKAFADAFMKLVKGDFSGAAAVIKDAFSNSMDVWADFGKKAGKDFLTALDDAMKNQLEPITEQALNNTITDIKTLVENEVKKILKMFGIDFKGSPSGGGEGGGGTPEIADPPDLSKWQAWKLEWAALFDGESFNKMTDDMLKNLVVDGIVSAFSAMGEAMVNGGNVLKAAGNAILAVIAQFLTDFATEIIKIAVATIVFGTLIAQIKAWIIANPVLAIIGAVALIAVASAFSAAAAKSQASIGGKGGGGGATRSTPSATTTTPSTVQGPGGGASLTAKVRGQDLRFVLQAADNSYNALS